MDISSVIRCVLPHGQYTLGAVGDDAWGTTSTSSHLVCQRPSHLFLHAEPFLGCLVAMVVVACSSSISAVPVVLPGLPRTRWRKFCSVNEDVVDSENLPLIIQEAGLPCFLCRRWEWCPTAGTVCVAGTKQMNGSRALRPLVVRQAAGGIPVVAAPPRACLARSPIVTALAVTGRTP